MASLHRVLRTFSAAQPIDRGEIIDASSWRNTTALVTNRYLAPFAGTPYRCSCDRMWESKGAAHDCDPVQPRRRRQHLDGAA